jgi:hypothetical protein
VNIYVGSISAPAGPVESWPVVRDLEGVSWYVAPVYVAPVARVDLPELLELWQCEVPSSELVDAIWRAADLRLDVWKVVRTPNTASNGQTQAAYDLQRDKLERLIAERPFTLLAGPCKDLANVNGRTDLYGWHTLTGEVIEHGRTSHSPEYVDYSQGLRLVRRV